MQLEALRKINRLKLYLLRPLISFARVTLPADDVPISKHLTMRFIQNVLATIVGIFLFTLIMFFVLMIIGAVAGSGAENVTVRDKSVIELDLSEINFDYAGKSNYKDFDYFDVAHNGLTDVLRAIDEAAGDDRIKGISIIEPNSKLGIAQTKALRDELEKFKKSGKFILAYSNGYNQQDYYLMSVADTVYINPVGNFDFRGLSAELMFFKDLQEKSGVKMEVIRHGKYKSAVEPFLDNKMSDANREQMTALLNSVWNSVVADISRSRKIPVAELNAIADNLLARTPEMAKSRKLVDKIAYEDAYHNAIRHAMKVEQDKKYNKIKIGDYAADIATTAEIGGKNEIAIIYAQGEILEGEGSESYIGEGSMRRALQSIRKNDKVKAVVLRIDSPGGSALTSDLIWREIELTRKEKPVVVSMGNVAASGGYYIACNANKIFAEANTITGSIGVFGLLPNLTQLSNKIGINTEIVSTHKNAADYSPFRPLDPNMRNFIQEDVERIYSTFVSRVAKGRKMTFAQVDSIGQGRVWSGTKAKEIGLVDAIGGMDDAIKEAAKLADVTDYRTRSYPEYEKDFGDLLAQLGFPFAKSRESVVREAIGEENFQVLERIRTATRRSGVRAALPYEIRIR